MVKLKNRDWIRDYISDLIKKGAVKAVLSWLSKKISKIVTGPLGWLASLIISQAWDFFGDKIVRWAVRKGTLIYDKIDGNIKAVKIKQARGRGDSSYDDAVDDVFN